MTLCYQHPVIATRPAAAIPKLEREFKIRLRQGERQKVITLLVKRGRIVLHVQHAF